MTNKKDGYKPYTKEEGNELMATKKKEIMPDEKHIAIGATNGNRPAFPSDFNYGDEDFTGMPIIVHKVSFGLTKREYFAGLNMAQMIADNWTDYVTAAKTSIKAADELLKQLNNHP